jgi:tol-pal system protein YbgF
LLTNISNTTLQQNINTRQASPWRVFFMVKYAARIDKCPPLRDGYRQEEVWHLTRGGIMRFWLTLMLFMLALATGMQSAAMAQPRGAMQDQLNRLERDLTFLQRQVYRGSNTGKAGATRSNTAVTGSTAILSELSALQEEMRKMRGAIERNAYQTRRTQSDLQRLSEDMDFRLNALELAEQKRQNPNENEPGFSIDAGKTGEDGQALLTPNATPTPSNSISVINADGKEAQALLTKAAAADINAADTHYNNAFALLNSKKYAQAAESFSVFLRKYPSDPLIPNAYYWLGESHYVRGDYVRAAQQFRKGYEAAPKGQKAADNLLKLGISLGKIKRNEEACIILQQVVTKFKTAATAATNARASQMRALLKCK